METKETSISPTLFYCESCLITCKRNCEWERHIKTQKHIGNQKETNGTTNFTEILSCDCGKKYSNRSGLWKHKQKCNQNTKIVDHLLKQNDDFKNMITEQNKMFLEQSQEMQKQTNELHKQNQELQKQILEICKNGIINNTITNNNSNNKTFNLNLFLYEDCKDAMNLSEFLESIKFQLADVEAVGELGYINGISKLIIQNLKGLDVTKRPIHCTDEKREIIYIKEGGVWTKDEDNSKLRRFIKTVSNRNFKHTRLYKEKHPDCIRSESKYSDTYNKIIIEATGGGSKCNDYESENKIMKKIAKAITIDKSEFLTKS